MEVSAAVAAESSRAVVAARIALAIAKMGGTDTPAEAARTALEVGAARQALETAQAQEIGPDSVAVPPSQALQITATPTEIMLGRQSNALVERQALGI